MTTELRESIRRYARLQEVEQSRISNPSQLALEIQRGAVRQGLIETQSNIGNMQNIPPAVRPYVRNNSVDLIQIAQSNNRAAINGARQLFGNDRVNTAIEMSKTPVTREIYERATPTVRRNIRIVEPVDVVTWSQIPESQRWRYYIEGKPVKASVAAGLGEGVLGRTAYYSPSTWESWTPWAEEKGQTATTARALAWQASIVRDMIPAVYTVRNWNKMSLPEKIGSAALDVLIIGAVVKPVLRGGIRALVPRVRIPAEVKLTISDAKNAGIARAELIVARDRLNIAQKAGVASDFGKVKGGAMPAADIQGFKTLEAELKADITKAAIKSRNADIKLLDRLSVSDKLTPADIRKIEKLSNYKGLKKYIDEVNKAKIKLANKWNALDKWAKAHNYNPAKMSADEIIQGKNRYYMLKLKDIEKAQSDLDRAMVRYSEKIRPRVTETPAPEFKGYQMQWTETKPTAGGGDDFDRLLKDSSDYFEKWQRAKAHELKEKAVYTLPKELKTETATKGRFSLETKPLFETPAAAELEAKAPKLNLATVTPDAKIGFAKLSTSQITEIAKLQPNSIIGATPAEITQFYAVQTLKTSIAEPIADIDTKAEIRTAAEINAQYQTALSSGLKTATNTFTDIMNRTGNYQQAINEAITQADAEVRAQLDAKTETKISTKVKSAIRTNVKTNIKKLLPARPKRKGDYVISETESEEITETKAGVIQFPQGLFMVTLEPPYTKAKYRLLKHPVKGRGSPQRGLRVSDGKVAATALVNMGKTEAVIRNGQSITYRPAKQRGRMILRRGKLQKVKRGTVI